MTGSRPRIYWDANCFLSYVDADPRWLPTLEVILEDANIHGTLEIVTSVLSITEVAFGAMERVKRALDPREEARIDNLWTSRGIALVEANERIARLAREIRRDDMLRGRTGRRTADIVHLATARFMRVQDMHTTDRKLHAYSGLYGFPVRDPYTSKMKLPGF